MPKFFLAKEQEIHDDVDSLHGKTYVFTARADGYDMVQQYSATSTLLVKLKSSEQRIW